MSALALQETEAPTGPAPTIFEAIVRRRCVTATYNRTAVVLAPHVIFTRHGELYVGATTLERDGQPPREEKLGLFKLDGLVDLSGSDRPFFPSAVFDRHDERYAQTALMTVEP
ncbi:WYL domain-containing protein [Sphingomonas japonica]|uniref:WYL domain-containing protein n=1 Tax=Sphingomonas japonica TaxID=511662 RepID=A0ABX0U3L0_9SPHN|nr:WYL domain-containing protein [Sphingomonas japonica]NIJ25169.1 hypothetical protein [Sphingomonas japonica]